MLSTPLALRLCSRRPWHCGRADSPTLKRRCAGRDLEGFIPKSAKDFEELGKLVAAKHLVPHAKSSHYKVRRVLFGCFPSPGVCVCVCV